MLVAHKFSISNRIIRDLKDLKVMHPPTLDRPSTLLQLHPNPMKSVLFIADRQTDRSVNAAPK
jgi:hypothetical protein